MPIIVSKLPNEIRLEISRKLGTNSWKIAEFMLLLKNEITARESCDYVNSLSNRDRENSYNHSRHDRRTTTQALFTNNRELKCCFCKQSHYHDKCTILTDIEARKKVVYDNRLC